MDGVVNVAPEPNNVVPVASYQLIVPPLHPKAVRLTVPVPHLELLAPVGTPGIAITVAVTAILAEVHPLDVAST